MKKEFFIALIAFVSQISGSITVLSSIGFLYGATGATSILFVTVPVFIITFFVVTLIKGGMSWFISWSALWPV